MTKEEALRRTIDFWMQSAEEALASARSECGAGRYRFTVNRAYYSCFYAASAVLLRKGRKFVKHTGVRAALHEHLVLTGLIDRKWGEFYDAVFRSRHEADYAQLMDFEVKTVEEMIGKAEGFVREMQHILS